MADNSDLDKGIIKSSGIGIREGERAALDEIAALLGVSRNAILRYMVRWFIIEYRAGKIDLAAHVKEPPPQKKKLDLPGSG